MPKFYIYTGDSDRYIREKEGEESAFPSHKAAEKWTNDSDLDTDYEIHTAAERKSMKSHYAYDHEGDTWSKAFPSHTVASAWCTQQTDEGERWEVKTGREFLQWSRKRAAAAARKKFLKSPIAEDGTPFQFDGDLSDYSCMYDKSVGATQIDVVDHGSLAQLPGRWTPEDVRHIILAMMREFDRGVQSGQERIKRKFRKLMELAPGDHE